MSRNGWTAGICFFGVLLFVSQALAGGVQFSADMVQKTEGQTIQMRYYHGDGQMRTEIRTPEGRTAVTITDLKARTVIQLLPDEKVYMEIPLGGEFAAWASDEKTRDEFFEMKHAGTETVNGLACDKYVMVPRKAGLEKSTTWISKRLGHPVKTVSPSFSMELARIKEGPQPASLFTIPKDYRKMAEPEDVYRGTWNESEDDVEDDGDYADDADEGGPPGGTGPGERSWVEEDARQIGEDARSAAKEEVSESVRKGIRSLFGRD